MNYIRAPIERSIIHVDKARAITADRKIVEQHDIDRKEKTGNAHYQPLLARVLVAEHEVADAKRALRERHCRPAGIQHVPKQHTPYP
jgi:hypothetical protein